MSAFMVSENHIRALVTGYLSTLPTASADTLARRAGFASRKGRRARRRLAERHALATTFGEELSQENYRSVEYRYPHKPDYLARSKPAPYQHAEVRVDLVTLYKSVLCYQCNADEHPRAELTGSWWVADEIRAWCEARGASEDSPAYDAAPWGIR